MSMNIIEWINKGKNWTLSSKLVFGLKMHAENMFYYIDYGKHKDFEHNNERLPQMDLK